MNRGNNSHIVEKDTTIDVYKELEEVLCLFRYPKFKFIQLEVYLENPYIFVSRIKEKNILSSIEENRLLISWDDRHSTKITVIPIEHIKELQLVTYSNNEYEIKFKIKGLNYKLWIEL